MHWKYIKYIFKCWINFCSLFFSSKDLHSYILFHQVEQAFISVRIWCLPVPRYVDRGLDVLIIYINKWCRYDTYELCYYNNNIDSCHFGTISTMLNFKWGQIDTFLYVYGRSKLTSKLTVTYFPLKWYWGLRCCIKKLVVSFCIQPSIYTS